MAKKPMKIKLLTPEEIEYARNQTRAIYDGLTITQLEISFKHNSNIRTMAALKLEILEELLDDKSPDWKLRQYID
jgi:hypothetical protein